MKTTKELLGIARLKIHPGKLEELNPALSPALHAWKTEPFSRHEKADPYDFLPLLGVRWSAAVGETTAVGSAETCGDPCARAVALIEVAIPEDGTAGVDKTLAKATTTPAKITATANLNVGSFFMMVVHEETETCPHSC